MRPQDHSQQSAKRRRFDINASARNIASPYYGASNQHSYPHSGGHPNNRSSVRSNFEPSSSTGNRLGHASPHNPPLHSAPPLTGSLPLSNGVASARPQHPNGSAYRSQPSSRNHQRHQGPIQSSDRNIAIPIHPSWLPGNPHSSSPHNPSPQNSLPSLYAANGQAQNSERQGTLPPFNNSISPTNTDAFGNQTLPPLSMPAMPPQLHGVDPFAQQFAPMEPNFRSPAQQPSRPVARTFPSRSPSALLGNSRPYSTAPTTTPNGRTIHHSSLPPNAQSPGQNGTSFNRNQYSNGRNKTLTGASNPSEALLSIRMIHPVKEALSLLSDSSQVMMSLLQTILQTGRPNVSGSAIRDRILGFKGFQQHTSPKTQWLLTLSKNDLEILAWIFVVSKQGKKEEVAKRIISSLKSPLKFRSPPDGKRPAIPAKMDARASKVATATALGPPPSGSRQNGRSGQSSRARGNMPILRPATVSPRAETVLRNLQRQLDIARTVNVPAHGHSQSQGRFTPQQSRARQMHNLCHELLQGYSFKVGENPFNDPLNGPLGAERYAIFNSMQLSRGNSDPTLTFATPAPLDPSTRPEIHGGDMQVHLRCLRVEVEKPKSEWKQAWPFPASCRVNGHSVTLNQAQRYTNGKLAGRDAATNITPYLRKHKSSSSGDMNRVSLRRQSSNATAASGQFVLFAQEVLVLSTETVTKSVFESSDQYWQEYRRNQEKKGIISSSTTKFEMAQQGVMQFLTDPDGLTVSSMKVSLRCPLALTRIRTPVKGKRCQHVQCFDLQNFLEYSRRSSKFDCPVCNKSTAYPPMLVISPYIEHALEKYKDCDEVEIFQDGSMVLVERKQTGVASDEEDEDGSNRNGNGTTGPGHSSGNTAEVVDLTLDSDEDDAPIVSTRHTRSAANGAGDLGRAEGEDADRTGQQGEADRNDVQVDQDMDFSFRADFALWGDHVDGEEDEDTEQVGNSNTRNNWDDVIAIDSD